MSTSKTEQVETGMQTAYNYFDKKAEPWFNLLGWTLILGTLVSLTRFCTDEFETYLLWCIISISSFLIIANAASLLHSFLKQTFPYFIKSNANSFIWLLIEIIPCLFLVVMTIATIANLVNRSALFK